MAAPFVHSAFYRFTPVSDPGAAAEVLRERCSDLHGSILIAPEGVNGAVSGAADVVARFEHAVQQTDVLRGALQGMSFKRSTGMTEPFGRLKVLVKSELVTLRLPEAATLPTPDETDASHVAPHAWRALLERPDVIVLDNRNHFEYRLGRFRGAVDPGVNRFRDFVRYVEAHAPGWRAAGQSVAMYCTGGIRCDKTAPWLRSLGLEVKQLDGGVLNYFQQMPDADRDWDGDCFVFDKRMAVNTALCEVPVNSEQVFDAQNTDEVWRLERARRLDQFGA